MTERLGADMADWRYGQAAMKYVHITNYMARAVNEETRQLLEVGPYPRGGYDPPCTTPAATTTRARAAVSG